MASTTSDHFSALKKRFWDSQTDHTKGVVGGILRTHMGYLVAVLGSAGWCVYKGYVHLKMPKGQVLR